MSTAGLQAPNARGADGEIDDSVAWFVAAFCVVGVPVFAVAVGSVAGVLLDDAVARRARGRPALSDDDFDRVKGLSVDDGVVDFGEFLVLELVRIGKVDLETVLDVKATFDEIDVDGTATLDRAEVRRFQKTTALRSRYAAFLSEKRGVDRGFALEAALELDVEYLVVKALKNGWLVEPGAAVGDGDDDGSDGGGGGAPSCAALLRGPRRRRSTGAPPPAAAPPPRSVACQTPDGDGAASSRDARDAGVRRADAEASVAAAARGDRLDARGGRFDARGDRFDARFDVETPPPPPPAAPEPPARPPSPPPYPDRDSPDSHPARNLGALRDLMRFATPRPQVAPR